MQSYIKLNLVHKKSLPPSNLKPMQYPNSLSSTLLVRVLALECIQGSNVIRLVIACPTSSGINQNITTGYTLYTRDDVWTSMGRTFANPTQVNSTQCCVYLLNLWSSCNCLWWSYNNHVSLIVYVTFEMLARWLCSFWCLSTCPVAS